MRNSDADLPPALRALRPVEDRSRHFDHASRLREPVSVDGWSPLWTGLARMGGLLPPAGIENPNPRPLPRGGRDAPWSGRSDGGSLGEIGERGIAGGPRFDAPVAPGGYAWWYIDAISEDGSCGLTIIAFIGSVFSPYYVSAGKQHPENHVALNVALYGRRKSRWTMTERSQQSLRRDPQTLAIGPSNMHWDGTMLSLQIEEAGAVFGQKVRGQVRLHPQALVNRSFALDPAGRHRWQPIATRAHIEVDMPSPGLSWRGDAYIDSNFGDEPMESRFADWQWSRAHLFNKAAGGETAVFYEGRRHDGSDFALSLLFDQHGQPHEMEAPPKARLRPTNWLMPRHTRSDFGEGARILKTWEDTPFYSRSALATRIHGQHAIGVHESLSLNRFRSKPMQWMLPYRMPRQE